MFDELGYVRQVVTQLQGELELRRQLSLGNGDARVGQNRQSRCQRFAGVGELQRVNSGAGEWSGFGNSVVDFGAGNGLSSLVTKVPGKAIDADLGGQVGFLRPFVRCVRIAFRRLRIIRNRSMQGPVFLLLFVLILFLAFEGLHQAILGIKNF